MLRLRYFATEPVTPCAICGNPMSNHEFWGTPAPPFHPGIYFATEDGQWVCSYCCIDLDDPLYLRCMEELKDDDVRNAPLLGRCPCHGVVPPFKHAEGDDWEENSSMYHQL